MKAVRLFRNGIRYVLDSDYRFCIDAGHGKYNNMPDEEYLKRMFKARLGYPLNLDNPQTFNEKLQWLKLHDRRPEYTVMVDKYEVKQYISDTIGNQYVIPTLGVWNHFDEIDFDALPNQFVLKCTHDSGGLVICRDKTSFDKEKARIKIEKCLKRNFFYYGREWPYKNVKPRIIAEKYMEDTSTSELRDYKFFCFNGVAKCYKVDFERFVEHHANYYDMEGNVLKLGEASFPPNLSKEIKMPKNLSTMKELAEKLIKTQTFLRADFYDVDEKIYFGELTLYPASGFGKLLYDGNDELLGSWIKLPENVGGGGMH